MDRHNMTVIYGSRTDMTGYRIDGVVLPLSGGDDHGFLLLLLMFSLLRCASLQKPSVHEDRVQGSKAAAQEHGRRKYLLQASLDLFLLFLLLQTRLDAAVEVLQPLVLVGGRSELK